MESAMGPGELRVEDGWLLVDGVRVARVEEGGVIAFHDKCRRRSSVRGTDQVRVEVAELVRVVEACRDVRPARLGEF